MVQEESERKKIRNFIIWGCCCQWNLETFRHSYSKQWKINKKGDECIMNPKEKPTGCSSVFFTSLTTVQLDKSLKPFKVGRFPGLLGSPKGSVRSCGVSFQGAQEFPRESEVQELPTSFPTLRTNGSKLLTLKRKTWNTLLHFREGIHEVAKTLKKSASNWKNILLLPRKLLHLWYFFVE